jgi:hypothetical protein
MASVKLNISLDEEIAEALRERAAELRKPASRYLADLVEEDMRRREDELAAEGYRLLSQDTAEFAAEALPVAAETWPEWEDEDDSRGEA